ncbi:MAG TPA: hypothetical protein VK028_06650 [Micromonosporaceae bacterium]|nr:hypothetical protein [Micromonosporaceae bacterium]
MWRRKEAVVSASNAAGALTVEEARRARESSEALLNQVRQRWPEIEQVADALRQHRERNGFAELFSRALGGGDSGAPGR